MVEVQALGKCCRAQRIEVAGCSAHMAVGMMRLQLPCQQLYRPMHTVDALSAHVAHSRGSPPAHIVAVGCDTHTVPYTGLPAPRVMVIDPPQPRASRLLCEAEVPIGPLHMAPWPTSPDAAPVPGTAGLPPLRERSYNLNQFPGDQIQGIYVSPPTHYSPPPPHESL